tara:strand:- start:1497 stop:1673 length:177 start_codon:yes stop_codon:yes gene_type:complete
MLCKINNFLFFINTNSRSIISANNIPNDLSHFKYDFCDVICIKPSIATTKINEDNGEK